jgi:nicotinamide mononucleotide (NMN) deamidase PncC
VAVRFTPTTLSPKTANLTFSHNGSGDTSVALSGSVAPSGGIASLSPGTIPFGTIANGSQSDPTTVTLRNNGNGPLTVSTVALTGENRFAFAVANDACTGVSVPVGGTCTVAVRFTPTTLSPKTANLTFSHNGGGDTSVALSGSVVQPGGIASLSPGTIAFGTIPDNSQTSTTTVTLANTGTGALTVGTVSFTGENRFAFTISNNACTGVSVPVGGTCTVGVRFTPTTLGAKTATLSLPHDGGGSTSVALTGTAS